MLGSRKDKPSRVLIVNDGRDCGAEYAPLFRQFGEISHDISALKLQPFDFRLVVFTGGADVDPKYYADTSPKGICHSNPARDAEERRVFGFARQRGIRMVGICRGMQFLNVMTGGAMMHDISGHTGGSHKVMTHDRETPFITNSFHHQMCILSKNSYLLAWSHERLSRRYIGANDEPVDYKGPEVEAFYHSWDKCLGVQWHPEVALSMSDDDCKESTKWFVDMVADHITAPPQLFKKNYLAGASDITVSEAH
jgi:GMP synthase-like glutamine amidotransferase